LSILAEAYAAAGKLREAGDTARQAQRQAMEQGDAAFALQLGARARQYDQAVRMQ
jgi:hypothetical protein